MFLAIAEANVTRMDHSEVGATYLQVVVFSQGVFSGERNSSVTVP